jgi:hypothetical protein
MQTVIEEMQQQFINSSIHDGLVLFLKWEIKGQQHK